MTTTGFSAVARELTEHYDADPPITRQQIRMWWLRATRNADGQPFPRELRVRADVPANRPNRDFSMTQVLAWASPGVPDKYGDGWRRLGNGRE